MVVLKKALKMAKTIWANEFVQPVKSIQLSYLPPLMIYFAYGVSALTAVVQTFFVTKVLGFQPNFLAILGYWAGVWWAFKMPIGHLVDRFWRYKAVFVFFGAALMAVSLGIMIGLTGYLELMQKYMSAGSWYIISVLMSPFAYMLQDVVADAMTSEAVPRFENDGAPVEEKKLKANHITMQLLGRAAILFGGFIVAGASGWFAKMPAAQTGIILSRILLGLFLAIAVFKIFKAVSPFLTGINFIKITPKLIPFIKGFLKVFALASLMILAICSHLGVINHFAVDFLKTWLAAVKSYEMIYWLALFIPASSVSGVILASIIRRRKRKFFLARGFSPEKVETMLNPNQSEEKFRVNWWILGGSAVYLLFLIPLGLLSLTFKGGFEAIPLTDFRIADLPSGLADWLPAHADTALFLISFLVICVLIARVAKELTPETRRILMGTAIIIFVFRATPSIGAGLNFYYIEGLKFDERFLGTLGQIGSLVAFFGLFFLRPMMAKKSIAWTYGFLTIIGTFFLLPVIGLVFGLHHWAAGILGADSYRAARAIALIDTVVESPFGQLAMVPLLAWIAQEAPPKYKATYFALMASFTNLALSAGTLGTRYLNEIFVIVKPVYGEATNALIKPGVYDQLGPLVIIVGLISFVAPLTTILLFTPLAGKEAIGFRILDFLRNKILFLFWLLVRTVKSFVMFIVKEIKP